MDLAATCVLGVLLILTTVLLALRSVLHGAVPVKGKTNIPGPGYTLPIIGDAWRFALVRNSKELLAVCEKLIGSSNKVLGLWMGSKLMVMVTDPKIGEIVMNSSKSANKDPDVYRSFNHFSDGVFSRNGKSWRSLRRPLNKLLQADNILKTYYSFFGMKSEELCEAFDSMCGKGPHDILHSIRECMLDIVYETIMGIPAESKLGLNFDVATVVTKLTSISMQLAVNPIYRFQFLLSFSPLNKEIEDVRSKCLIWGEAVNGSRMKILEEKSLNSSDPNFEPESFVDVTMQVTESEPPQDDRCRELSKPLDLAAAGFDTSATALASVVLFLAMHPEYQEKAYQEQIRIMGDSLRPPTQEEITKMDYLWMVFQETLRHIGSPGVFRLISSELVIDDYIFPEGTSVYISIHSFNFKPENWVKTKEFYPDNFSPENVARRPNSAWLPFSGGARVCPGKAFAHLTAKVILSTLVRRFKFTTTLKFDEMNYEYLLMIESTKGYPVTMERRISSS